MTNLYYVGGGLPDASDASNWSSSSGGAGGAGTPASGTSTFSVIFDAKSPSGPVNFSSNYCYCASWDSSAATNLTFSGFGIIIGFNNGSPQTAPAATFITGNNQIFAIGQFVPEANGGTTITIGSGCDFTGCNFGIQSTAANSYTVTLASNISFGSMTLNIASGSTITFTCGSFNVALGSVTSSTSGGGWTVNSTGTWTLYGTGTIWGGASWPTTLGGTFFTTPGSASMIISDTSPTTKIIQTGLLFPTLVTLTIAGAPKCGAVQSSASNVICQTLYLQADSIFSVVSAGSNSLEVNAIQTDNVAGHNATLNAITPGSQAIVVPVNSALTGALPYLFVDYINLKDIKFTALVGAAAPIVELDSNSYIISNVTGAVLGVTQFVLTDLTQEVLDTSNYVATQYKNRFATGSRNAWYEHTNFKNMCDATWIATAVSPLTINPYLPSDLAEMLTCLPDSRINQQLNRPNQNNLWYKNTVIDITDNISQIWFKASQSGPIGIGSGGLGVGASDSLPFSPVDMMSIPDYRLQSTNPNRWWYNSDSSATFLDRAAMQRFWVTGGNGNWSSSTNWSTGPSGASGASAPTSSQDAVFISSLSVTITIDTAVTCCDFLNASTCTFAYGSNTLTVSGNYRNTSGNTNSTSGSLILAGSSGNYQYITAGGTANVLVNLNAPGSTYNTIFSGGATIFGTGLTITNGTLFATGNLSLSGGELTWGVGTKTLNLNNFKLTASGTGTIIDLDTNNSGGTVICNMDSSIATIVISNTSASTKSASLGPYTYGTVNIAGAASNGKVTLTGDSTIINNLILNPNSNIAFAGTLTVVSPSWLGTVGNLITLTGPVTIQDALFYGDYLSITSSTLTGPVAYAGSHSTNGGSNSGWTFTVPPTATPGELTCYPDNPPKSLSNSAYDKTKNWYVQSSIAQYPEIPKVIGNFFADAWSNNSNLYNTNYGMQYSYMGSDKGHHCMVNIQNRHWLHPGVEGFDQNLVQPNLPNTTDPTSLDSAGKGLVLNSPFINSIQQVSITISSSTTGSTQINPVGPNAFIIFQNFTATGAGGDDATSQPNVSLSGNTVVATLNTAGSVVVNCVVIDATSNLVSNVQFGSITLSAILSNTYTLPTPISVNNSAVFTNGYISNRASVGAAASTSPYLVLTNGNTVTATSNNNVGIQTINFCVVTFNPNILQSNVQQLSYALTAAGASETKTITAVQPSNSIIAWGGQSNIGGTTLKADVWAQLTNYNTLTFTNFSSNGDNTDVALAVIEFIPGVLTSVQRGSIALAAATSNTASISSFSNTFVSFIGMTGNGTTDATMDFSLTLTNPTTITASSNTAATGTIAYEAISFSNGRQQAIYPEVWAEHSRLHNLNYYLQWPFINTDRGRNSTVNTLNRNYMLPATIGYDQTLVQPDLIANPNDPTAEGNGMLLQNTTRYINSIQSFQMVVASGSSATQSIGPVGPNAFLVYNNSKIAAGTGAATNLTRVALTNSTTITATWNTTIAGAVVIQVYVIDPTSNLVSSVQQGTITIPTNATSGTATISSVVTGNSAVFFLGANVGITTASNSHPSTSYNVVLTNSTTVTANVNTSNASFAATVGFVVVTFNPSALNQNTQQFTVAKSSLTTNTQAITQVALNNTITAWGGTTTGTDCSTTPALKLTDSKTATLTTISAANFSCNFTVIEFIPAVLMGVFRGLAPIVSTTSVGLNVGTNPGFISASCLGTSATSGVLDTQSQAYITYTLTTTTGQLGVAVTSTVTALDAGYEVVFWYNNQIQVIYPDGWAGVCV